MKCFDFSFKACALAVTAAWWLASEGTSQAANDVWDTAVSGSWETGTNWADNSTPVGIDTATFNLAGAYNVSFGSEPSAIGGLILTGAANVTFHSLPQGHTLRVNATSAGGQDVTIRNGASLTLGRFFTAISRPLHLTVGDELTINSGSTLNVGFGSDVSAAVPLIEGELNVTNPGSTFTTSEFYSDGGAVNVTLGGVIQTSGIRNGGDITVSGAGSRWTNTGLLQTGEISFANALNGTLSITGGGLVESVNAKVGSDSGAASGTVTVSGSGSLWKTTNQLTIGQSGPGTVNIQPGGTVSVSGDTIIAPNGRLRLQGGIFDTGELHAGLFEWTSGTYRPGTHHGDLLNQSGTLAPGHSAGSAAVTGIYTQQSAAALEIEIGGAAQGSQYDTLNVTGTASLDGRLDLKLIDGFVPTPAQSFIIMNTNAVAGAFANAANGQRLTTVDGGGSFLVHYGPTSAFDPALVVLSGFQSGGLLGDFDVDGDVDGADFLVWQRGGSPSPLSAGDLADWRGNFGFSQFAAVGSGVPEPRAAWLALPSILLGWLYHRPRRR